MRSIRRGVGREEGVALIMVMGMAGVLSVLVGIIAVQSVTNLRQAGLQRNFEEALHVADAGLDVALFRLRTATPKGNYSTAEALGTTGSERQRVMVAAQAAVAAGRLQTTPNGQWVHIVKPDASLKTGSMYSVSWVPSYANPRRLRVIKARYDFAPFSPGTAILSDGNITISGNPQVRGTHGSVHANGNIVISGNPDADGSISASGTFTSGKTCQELGWGDCDGSGAGKPEKEVPEIIPREFHYLAQYELCPNGEVHAGPAHSNVALRNTSGTPCAGGSASRLATAGSEYRGWKKTGDDPSQGAKWDLSGNSSFPGVYYAFEGSLKVSGNPGEAGAPWEATLIAEARAGGHSHSPCSHVGGDIDVSGNPTILPNGSDSDPQVLLVAGRDLMISGNPGAGKTNYQGFIGAHEQFKINGNPSVKGTIVANDACDTPGSPIGQNQISSVSGNPTVEFNGGDVPLAGTIRTTLWLEI